MATRPLVSVVIPTFNRLALLKETVESVCAQRAVDWEAIIVDDASPDGTWLWLAQLTHPRIKCLRLAERSERSTARNHGLAQAAGDFVMFLDDDDRLRDHALATLLEPLQQSVAVAAIGAKWRFEEWGPGTRIHHVRRPTTRVIWPELLFGWGPIHGQTLFRTTAVREAGGFAPSMFTGQDRDLWFRVARSRSVVLVPRVVLEYRIHGGQWRPDDLLQIRERIFTSFIDSLPPDLRRRALRIRESARSMQRADRHYLAKQYGAAFASYARACLEAPALCFSPVTGPLLVRGLVRSLRRAMTARATR
jgi:glycosyltransferase involved in cell wall biosynthesis